MSHERTTCHYCGQYTVQYHMRASGSHAPRNGRTRDHIVPIARGGKNSPSNYVTACYDCNTDKSRLSYEEYRLVRAFRAGALSLTNWKFPGERNGA